jgi:hypothetical protein
MRLQRDAAKRRAPEACRWQVNGMKRPPPEELDAILNPSGGTWELSSLKWWAMGWTAEFRVQRREFRLVSDRGYIDAYELINGKDEHLFPPEDQRIRITPKQVRALIQEALLKNN